MLNVYGAAEVWSGQCNHFLKAKEKRMLINREFESVKEYFVTYILDKLFMTLNLF